jgi:PAS domain S-box-containing protein
MFNPKCDAPLRCVALSPANVTNFLPVFPPHCGKFALLENPHPQPLSQREKGAKLPLLWGEGLNLHLTNANFPPRDLPTPYFAPRYRLGDKFLADLARELPFAWRAEHITSLAALPKQLTAQTWHLLLCQQTVIQPTPTNHFACVLPTLVLTETPLPMEQVVDYMRWGARGVVLAQDTPRCLRLVQEEWEHWQKQAPPNEHEGTAVAVNLSLAPVASHHTHIPSEKLVAIIQDSSQWEAAQAILRQSEEKFRTIADWTSDWEYWLNPDGDLLYISPSVEQITGYTPEAFRQNPLLIQQVVHPEDLPQFKSHSTIHRHEQITPDSDDTDELEFRIIQANGEVSWIHHVCRAVFSREGKPLGRRVSNRDITWRKEAEKALQESEAQYRTTLMAMSEGVVLQDMAGQIRLCNRAAERILGLTQMQMMGRTSLDPRWQAIHEDGSPFTGHEHPAMVSLRTGKPQVNVVMGVYKPTGELTWIMINSQPVFGPPEEGMEGGMPTAVVTTFTDITARKQAEDALRASEEKFRQFIESAPVATVICNLTGEIILVNHELEHLLGYKRQELLGEKVEKLVPSSLREGHASQRTIYTNQRTNRMGALELSAETKDGRVLAVDIQLNRIQLQAEQVVMVLMTDVTSRKQAELAFKQALAQEKELGELKSRFVSMASHEFRTPLSAIMATTESLALYRSRMNEEQIGVRLERIRQQVNHMKLLMEDVLDLARIQAGRMPFNPVMVNLDRLCREVLEECETGWAHDRERSRIELVVEPVGFTAVVDPSLMRQIMSNLISNALKYSPTTSPVQVHLSLQENQLISFTVIDHGIGIPANDLKFLYQPFHRGANVGTIPGTGLGLSITKEAVELHGGKLTVISSEPSDSSPQQGCTVIATLPYRHAL